jgi:hypothetical protein
VNPQERVDAAQNFTRREEPLRAND